MAVFTPAGSSSISIGSLPITVTTPTLQNVPAALANTEYSITIPAGTKRFELRSRFYGNLKIAYVATQTSTNYWTLEYSNVYSEGDLSLGSPLIIYFQTSRSNDVIEVKTWS